MQDLQDAKRVVLDFYSELDTADSCEAALERHCAPDLMYRGVHPFNVLKGPHHVAQTVWHPLRAAIGPWQRRPDIFMAGRNHMDGERSVWVVEMGHLCGNWRAPWLGMPPSDHLAFLRYCEFHRVANGKIAETASFLEVLGMAQQAGVYPLKQTGASILSPGPKTHDGLLYDKQDPEASKASLRVILNMVRELVAEGVSSTKEHLNRHWTQDMRWFGPAGIGLSGDIDGYMRGHTGPFQSGLTFVRADGHQVEFAEGAFGGFFGYPSLTMRNSGGFMGLPPSPHEAEMRLVDLYRVEGGKLAENWIFIDLLHFTKMQGVDLLAEMSG